jgi:ferredoxin
VELVKVYAIYFSPTGTTEKVTVAAAKGTGLPGLRIDFTPWQSRENYSRSFTSSEIAVVGLPVYGGRLPGRIDNFFNCLTGNQTPAIAIVVYGHREYEDALIELKMRLEGRGFKVIAGAAFLGEHTYSANIATGRPDDADLAIAKEFGRKVKEDIDKAYAGTLTVKGNYPYVKQTFDPTLIQGDRYTGWAQVGTRADCSFCGICEDTCPWHAITIDENVLTNYAKCLRCFRCIKVCPEKARNVIDPNFPLWVERFEKKLEGPRREPELFMGD